MEGESAMVEQIKELIALAKMLYAKNVAEAQQPRELNPGADLAQLVSSLTLPSSK